MDPRLGSEDGRREIRDEFFRVFGIYRDEELAEHVKAAARTVARWRDESSVPQPLQAQQLLTLIEQGAHSLVISEDELARRGEEARMRRESAQREVRHTELNQQLSVPVPRWYADARSLIKDMKWNEARAILSYWADQSRDGGFDQVPELTRPYVLQSYGLTLYYSGRYTDAETTWYRAVAAAEGVDIRSWDRLACSVMLSSAEWRQKKFPSAFLRYDEVVRTDPAFHYAYFNALCAADLARDAIRLSHWCGRTEIAARDHFSGQVLREFIDRAQVDSDLKWARAQPRWQQFIDWLEDVYRSTQRQQPLTHQKDS